MANLYTKLRGIIGSILQLDVVNDGPNLKNNAGVLEIRNAADSDFEKIRGAAPTGDNDLATKLYVDSSERAMIISRQADTSVSLPNNTAARGFVVVTTAGSGAAIGDVLFDDGTSTGTMTILAAQEGRTLAVTDALTGGSITFDADSVYIWDDDGSTWIKIGDVGSVTGGIRAVKFSIGTANVDSVTALTASDRVLEVRLTVTTPYPSGATIDIGSTTTADLYMDQTDNNPQKGGAPNTFKVTDQDVAADASVIRATVGGSPGSGAAEVIVLYTNPNG